MVFSCTFEAIPRGNVGGGKVRFLPRVSGFTAPIEKYAWTFGDPNTSHYPPLQDGSFVKATSSFAGGNYYPYFATDPAKSLTGVSQGNSWLSTFGATTNQRVHIDIGTAAVLTCLYYENMHHLGAFTNQGAKTFTIWGSNDPSAFAELTYGIDTGWTQLPASKTTFDQHVASNTADPKYVSFVNSTAYRYYAIKIADNWGDTTGVGVRRFEFKVAAPISSEATPIHLYPDVLVQTNYTVTLTVTDSAGNTATLTQPNFIISSGTAPILPGNGTYQAIGVLIYDEYQSMLVTRQPTPLCNFYLMTPKTTNTIDKIGTATFSLLDIGTTTVVERSLNAAGKNVMIFAGKNLVFSGKIRRCTQNLQRGFDSSTAVYLWDLECDSDYATLMRLNVAQSVLDPNGNLITDSPGNLARLILTPDIGEFGDSRGIINTVDAKIHYQLNSQNNVQSAGDRYDHLETVRIQTNYDVRTRMDYLLFQYSTYAANVVTISGASFTVNEFVGCWAIFPLDYLNGGAANNGEVKAYGRITANAADTITIATLNGAASLPATLDYILIARWPVIDFAQDLTEPTPATTLQVNSTIFDYSDNDDQKKLITKSVCQGKDLQGITISVALSACHAYNNEAQFFNDATFISALSEGYVYQNTHTSDAVSVTGIPTTVVTFTVNHVTLPTSLTLGSPKTFCVGQPIIITASITPPAPLVGFKLYYVAGVISSTEIQISITRGGAPIIFTSSGSGIMYIYSVNNLTFTCGNYLVLPHNLDIIGGNGTFSVGETVQLTFTGGGSLPTPLAPAINYFVVAVLNNGATIWLSTSVGGAPITITSSGTGTSPNFIMYSTAVGATSGFGGLQLSSPNTGNFVNGQRVSLFGTTMPAGLSAGALYYIVNANIGDQWIQLSNYIGGTPTNISSSGSDVSIFGVNNLINPNLAGESYPYIWLYGWDYRIQINDVLNLVVMGGVQTAITVVATPAEVTMNDGSKCTRFRIGKMLGNNQDFSGRGYCLSSKLWVNNATRVYSSGTVTLLVGSELLTVTGSGTDPLYGPYLTVNAAIRIPSTSLIAYPHGMGALVARTNYTETSPEPGSAVAEHGVLLETVVSDQNVTYGDLDTYATLTLLGKSNFWPKAETWGPFNYVYVPKIGSFYGGVQQASVAAPPQPGQSLFIQENVGVSAVEWQIVSVTLDFDRGTVSLILGDFEKNLFTTLQSDTAGLNFTVT